MNVGITGHQRLDSIDAWDWVSSVLRLELLEIPRPLVGITSLAIGADQLFASLVLDSGGSLHAVLPYLGIEKSFAPEDLPLYRKLKASGTSEVLETMGSDEDSYLAAGFRVVNLSDLVIAVWNGLPAEGKGGTADVVNYACERRVPWVHVNPAERSVRRYEHTV